MNSVGLCYSTTIRTDHTHSNRRAVCTYRSDGQEGQWLQHTPSEWSLVAGAGTSRLAYDIGRRRIRWLLA
jgi:hypothetical protein